ncbi:hypothetical protein DTL70_22370 [Streptomyces diacarni]|uniref:Integral membrane protein n=1 Tax=Streptomyces diacarni TaxID=2800381 RepID=A0A367EP83_9ACTN|nr:hypothetical protein [Streptomyces diacarni]RCG19522.1 hypothetical protein DTL70_22370 [Streptomyces diacarni]
MNTHPAPAGPDSGSGSSADPVRVLLSRHSTLCERAVDPLEIAAGLEAGGVTDRTVASCRHRDVFSLAEELYARAPRREDDAQARTPLPSSSPAPDSGTGTETGTASLAGSGHPDGGAGPTGPARGPVAARLLAGAVAFGLPLLPGLLCAGTLAWLVLLESAPPAVRAVVCAVGAGAVLGSGIAAVRAVPATSRAAGVRPRPFPVLPFLCVCWLIGYALYGDWLLRQLLGGGPEFPGTAPAPPPPGVPLGLALALAPAVWCARGFARGARRKLAGCRSLGEFSARVRPLLALAVCAFAISCPALQWGAHTLADGAYAGADGAYAGADGAYAGAEAVDVPAGPVFWATAAVLLLLFAALLLGAHGFRQAVRAGLLAACALEAAVLLSVPAARLPRLQVLSRPVEALAAHQGTACVPLAACGCAALVLLAYASVTLPRASAHHREAAPA